MDDNNQLYNQIMRLLYKHKATFKSYEDYQNYVKELTDILEI